MSTLGISTTREKYMHELEDLYDAEHQFLAGQEELLAQATEPTLQQLIQQHIAESQEQIANLDEVFGMLGEKPKRQACAGAKGLLTEAHKTLKEAGNEALRDCLIASSAEKVEHYEIPSYLGLILGAEHMGEKKVVTLLKKNLKQEQATAALLQKSAPQLLERAMAADAQ